MNIPFLLEILACPKCHGKLDYLENDNKAGGFLCKQCGVVYPVENEIPAMLIEKSIQLGEFMKKQEKA